MLPLQQLLNETTTSQSNGGPKTTETMPGERNADSTSIVVDTLRKTNTLVSDENNHKTKFYLLDEIKQRKKMRGWLTRKKESKYNILDDASKEEGYLDKHIEQLIHMQTSKTGKKHYSRTAHMSPASPDQQGVVLPSSATPAALAVAEEPRPSRIEHSTSQQAPLIKQGVEGRTSASAPSAAARGPFTTPRSLDSPLASPFPRLATAQRSE